MTVTTSPCAFSKKNGPIMPLDENPHKTVTRCGCIGFSKYASGFSTPQIRQFCLFTYLPRSKMIFFANIVKSNVAIFPSVVQVYTQPYLFGGRINLIIYQIRHELSVNIYKIRTSWKKNVRWRTLYFEIIKIYKMLFRIGFPCFV